VAITREQVEYVAYLSRLELTDEEKSTFAGQLDSILQYVDKLNELDTERVEPMIHVTERVNVFREDAPGESLPRDDALGNAPEQSTGCFKVPRIID
jgi:aspartyl-tRNA(Asn)/glutamyl-tRNA(Gln) amidotransferase subunit C